MESGSQDLSGKVSEQRKKRCHDETNRFHDLLARSRAARLEQLSTADAVRLDFHRRGDRKLLCRKTDHAIQNGSQGHLAQRLVGTSNEGAEHLLESLEQLLGTEPGGGSQPCVHLLTVVVAINHGRTVPVENGEARPSLRRSIVSELKLNSMHERFE